jgi:hypothetical protein
MGNHKKKEQFTPIFVIKRRGKIEKGNNILYFALVLPA